MNSVERKIHIEEMLMKSSKAIKGQELAQDFGVTRQVIVKDISIMRAEGKNIIATPEGYIIPVPDKNLVKRIVAFYHKSEAMEEELNTIVNLGGVVEEVIIEHAVYGEIRGMLMLKNKEDVTNFIKRFHEFQAEPLSSLTGGIHLHTIATEDEDTMNTIIGELKRKNYLLADEN